ncbi:hypothetical protein SAMN03080615_02445 [Amphritea atlantica]|uniref:Uncharacterized protein n=1 Tax=Amphritea atlantica TaxID=355243 RepID=A0A1H9I5K8_9GAMM|nr:hypothetical protein [Amphritea atlantica]SEQ69843.1 hypothetical protein SAMN03080615_02445 [Amphritea atlantica]
MDMILLVALDAVITGAILWMAGKVTAVHLNFSHTVIAAGAASLVSLIPSFGWPLSIIILFYLLKQFSDADIWPDIILLVLVSQLILFAVGTALSEVSITVS